MTAEAVPSVTERIEEDHRSLRERVKGIAGLLKSEAVPVEEFPAWKLSVLVELRDFQNRLQKHFDLEEVTTYGGDILRIAPQYANRLNHLEEEHEKIAGDLGHIIAMFKRLDAFEPALLQRLDRRMQTVLECLHDHEAEERSLLQDVFFQDTGVGD